MTTKMEDGKIKMPDVAEKLGMREKIGYAFGDLGCSLLFALIGSLLQKFYTDILYIEPSKIMVMFLIARVWDAFTDPMWGRIVDTRKPRESGRYKQWVLWGAVPLAASAAMMFVKIPGLSPTGYLVFAYITYIIFGLAYTVVNIPYGSMASVITTNETDRSTLSIFRSIGAGIGSLPSMIVASICYVTVTLADGSEGKKMSFPIMIIGIAVIAVLSVIMLVLCNKTVKERVKAEPKTAEQKKKGETGRILLSLIKNRAFVAVCIASMLLIAGQMFTQTYYLYLFDYYFGRQELYILVMVCTYAPIALLMLFMNKLIKLVGKKELCAYGMLFAGLMNLVLFFFKTTNPFVFLAVCFASGIGITFFVLEVWALVNDVIDYHSVTTGIKEEATSYSFFSFSRKIGQTVAGVLSTQALVWISYKTGENVVQDPATVSSMYDIAVLVPAILFIGIFVVLFFIYPLNKKKLAELQEQKKQFYAAREE